MKEPSGCAKAVELYRQHKDEIDIVVIDLGLPEVTGWEVIRTMKEQDPGVKVIITTGYLQPELKSNSSGPGKGLYPQTL